MRTVKNCNNCKALVESNNNARCLLGFKLAISIDHKSGARTFKKSKTSCKFKCTTNKALVESKAYLDSISETK